MPRNKRIVRLRTQAMNLFTDSFAHQRIYHVPITKRRVKAWDKGAEAWAVRRSLKPKRSGYGTPRRQDRTKALLSNGKKSHVAQR